MAHKRSIFDIHRNAKWMINRWHIQFLFSEQLLAAIKHQTKLTDWHENPEVATAYIARLATCFDSINIHYEMFSSLPLPGDSLLDANTGVKIIDRRIDGERRTVTFVLSELPA